MRLPLAIAALLIAAPVFAQEAEPAYLDDRSTAESVIASYYNAISRAEFVRAYSYFGEDDAPAFEAWRDGYADTADVAVTFGQSAQEGAAGSVYWTVPVKLDVISSAGGAHSYFAGCYTLRLVQPINQEQPPFRPLHIVKGDLKPVDEQGLVYVFIALSALGVAAAAYFGLTFTPIEAAVTAIAFGCLSVLLVERQIRRRAEQRLEKAVEDLSRLLSTDAQAGSVLSQRVNALTELKAGPRLEAIETDLSVLGAVVKQVTETVAELEERRRIVDEDRTPPPVAQFDTDTMPEPVIPLEMLRQAVEDRRVVFHIEPIVSLPQRKPHAYDLVPRLVLEDEEFADRPDFMPRHGGEDVVARLEAEGVDEAIVIARRARTAGAPITLHIPVSRASLGSPKAVDLILASLDANRAITNSMLFVIEQNEFRLLNARERASLAAIGKMGVGLSLAGATSLRIDYAEMQGLGFKSLRVDATRFLRAPSSFTDFHAADVAAYGRRFGIEMVASGIIDEQQLLQMFEDGITLAQGPHIAGPGPVRPDLQLDRPAQMARAGA